MDIGALSLTEVLITSAREFYTDPLDKIADELRALAVRSPSEDRVGAVRLRARGVRRRSAPVTR